AALASAHAATARPQRRAARGARRRHAGMVGQARRSPRASPHPDLESRRRRAGQSLDRADRSSAGVAAMKHWLGLGSGAWSILKEAARHVLRHPVVGVAVVGQTDTGRWLLIRRRDTGDWALPGGTLEWGETLLQATHRELMEEAGVTVQGHVQLSCVYS